MRGHAGSALALAIVASAAAAPLLFHQPGADAAGAPTSPLAGSPIEHVVVIYEENHSFNDLLGKLCVQEENRCLGTTVGTLSDGSHMDLLPEPDLPPPIEHVRRSQITAIDGGKMDGWDRLFGCGAEYAFRCMTQAQQGSVPGLWALADQFTISDMTFETGLRGSWGSHLQLVAATINGFVGDEPSGPPNEHGDGCDTHQTVDWDGGHGVIFVPSCVPDKRGRGPFEKSPVKYVPTIMTRMDAAGLPWHIYAPGRKQAGYGWAICPTFYECLGGPQHDQVRRPSDFAADAAKGRLPALSIVIPQYNDSQHNGYSLIRGDNWISTNVSAVMNGPDWDSTAIFIVYDDCGCFYDPVVPPADAGIRVPMVIVSPYARQRFVDHTVATDASMLAFTEHLFGLRSLSTEDANAYDYAGAFDFSQAPLPPIPLPQHAVPLSSVRYMAEHPPDPKDPT